MVSQDLPLRIQFYRTFIDLLNPNVLNHLIMCGEVYFHSSGNANKYTSSYWVVKQSQYIHEQPLHSVWCGVAGQ